MIRIIDRYLLNTFSAALLVFALAFGTLFLVVDFASNLGKFLEIRSVHPVTFMFRYYAARLPMILDLILPTVILFASIFTVARLARNNEILPVAASGTSLRRMSLPFLAAAAAAGLAMAALDEFAMPRLADRIAETEDILNAKEVSYAVEDWDGWTKLYAREYNHANKTLSNVQVTRVDGDARPVMRVVAKTCRWEGGHWVAYDGSIEYPKEFTTGLGGRPQVRVEPIEPSGYTIRANFTPRTLRRRSSLMNMFPFATMSALLEQARRFPHVPSYVMKVHARFTFPLSPLVLVLLGLPFVVGAQSGGFLKSIFFCFLVALAYYLVQFACMMLGHQDHMAPAAAAWLPTALFGTAGLAAFLRMKT